MSLLEFWSAWSEIISAIVALLTAAVGVLLLWLRRKQVAVVSIPHAAETLPLAKIPPPPVVRVSIPAATPSMIAAFQVVFWWLLSPSGLSPTGELLYAEKKFPFGGFHFNAVLLYCA